MKHFTLDLESLDVETFVTDVSSNELPGADESCAERCGTTDGTVSYMCTNFCTKTCCC